jgi:hypothetical protein
MRCSTNQVGSDLIEFKFKLFKMNFSDFIAHSNGIVEYSPSGDLVAVAKQFEVKVSFPMFKHLIDLRNQQFETHAPVFLHRCRNSGPVEP